MSQSNQSQVSIIKSSLTNQFVNDYQNFINRVKSLPSNATALTNALHRFYEAHLWVKDAISLAEISLENIVPPSPTHAEQNVAASVNDNQPAENNDAQSQPALATA